MFWYEDDIKRLEQNSFTNATETETIFYGSSSIRMWDNLYIDFADLKPVNLGFGGSTLAACVWFFERVMINYHPKRVVVYAGDNDLGDGRHPEEIFIFFQQLVARCSERFGDIPCYFISLKPSVSRLHLIDQFRFTNKIIAEEIAKYHNNWHYIDIFKEMFDASGNLIREYYQADGLHLSKSGYDVWKRVVRCVLQANQ